MVDQQRAAASSTGGKEWSCKLCTFINPEEHGECVMCETPRVPPGPAVTRSQAQVPLEPPPAHQAHPGTSVQSGELVSAGDGTEEPALDEVDYEHEQSTADDADLLARQETNTSGGTAVHKKEYVKDKKAIMSAQARMAAVRKTDKAESRDKVLLDTGDEVNDGASTRAAAKSIEASAASSPAPAASSPAPAASSPAPAASSPAPAALQKSTGRWLCYVMLALANVA
jgi:hypothetical protein